MEKQEIVKMAENIAEKYDYPKPIIKFSNRMIYTLGKCRASTHEITLSKKYCDFAKDSDIEDLLKHEIAHIKHQNHGTGFKIACREMKVSHNFNGAHSSTDGYSDHISKDLPIKYACPSGHIVRRSRPYRKIHSCGKCSATFDKRYILERQIF